MMRIHTSLALAALFLAASVQPLLAKTLRVPANYPTVQSAVNAAHPGDTVLVYPKTGADPFYRENIRVSVPNITLQGKNGVTLDGTGLVRPWSFDPNLLVGDNGITLNADGVTVTGFTIQNYDYDTDEPFPQPAAGVAVMGRTSSKVRNNRLIRNGWGVRVEGLSNNTISQNHTVTSNDLSDNSYVGAFIRLTDGLLTLTDNIANRNGQSGMVLIGANGSIVANNTASNNGFGLVESEFSGTALWVDFLGAGAAGILISGGGGKNLAPSIFAHNTTNANAGGGIFALFSVQQWILNNLARKNGTVSPYSGFAYGLGIGGDSCIELTIEHNVVEDTLRDGLALNASSKCQISSNHVRRSGENGIALYDFFGFGETHNNQIHHNHARRNGNGIERVDAVDQTGTTALGVLNYWRHNHLDTCNPLDLD
jgi:parallel beta-helix repeat protein